MRSFAVRNLFHWLGGIASAAGLAVFGYINPALGVVLLFGGVALWLATQKGAIAVIRRWARSIASGKAGNGTTDRRKEAQAQFLSLNDAEREGLKMFVLYGTALPNMVTSQLGTKGYAEPEKVVDSIRGKTSFLVGSFSGEVSINSAMKDILEELLEEPLLAHPIVGYAVMAFVIVAVVGSGYLFYTRIFPGKPQTKVAVDRSTPEEKTTVEHSIAPTKQGDTSEPSKAVQSPAAPVKPKQGNHLPKTGGPSNESKPPTLSTPPPSVQGGPPSQSCPNGVCIGGDNNGVAIVNNVGLPLPVVSWSIEDKPPLKNAHHPQVCVKIRIDKMFVDAKFAV